MKGWGLILVLAAAACSGGAAVLQARAARDVVREADRGAGLFVRLLGRRTYLAALALIALGFLLTFVALRVLPLFVVQAGRASSLAVTAVIVALLGTQLTRAEVGGVAVVVCGLALLGATAGTSASPVVATGPGLGLLATVAINGAFAAWVTRRSPAATGGVLLAFGAGVGFGLLAVAARILRTSSIPALLTDPAAWAGGCAALSALLLVAMAYQRADVVAVTATMVATETLLSSGIGLIIGDRPAPRLTVLAAVGFTAAVAGALALARFGSLSPSLAAPRAR